MTAFPLPTLEAKLTWDGSLTFVGGLLAFFAILYQVRKADRGLQKQLDVEKQAREDEADERRRAVATALLFEIDHVYRQYVRAVWEYFEKKKEDGKPDLLAFYQVGSERLAIYRGNAGQLGSLPVRLVSTIVEWYGSMQSHFARIIEYSKRYAVAMQTRSALSLSQATDMLPQIKESCPEMANRTYFACGLLCEYTSTEFASPGLAVVNDSTVSEETRTALSECVRQSQMRD